HPQAEYAGTDSLVPVGLEVTPDGKYLVALLGPSQGASTPSQLLVVDAVTLNLVRHIATGTQLLASTYGAPPLRAMGATLSQVAMRGLCSPIGFIVWRNVETGA